MNMRWKLALVILVVMSVSNSLAQMVVKNSAQSPLMIVTQDGRVGIGKTDPSQISALLQADGARFFSTFWGIPSYVGAVIQTNNEGAGDVVERGLVVSVPSSIQLNPGKWRKALTAVVWDESNNRYAVAGSMASDSQLPVAEGGTRDFRAVEGYVHQGFAFPANSRTMAGHFASGLNGPNDYNLYVSGAAKSYFQSSMGIGTTLPRGKFDVAGTVWADLTAGSGVPVQCNNGQLVINTSSEKIKENIRTFQTKFDAILDARPVTFNYKGQDQSSLGYIAEEFDALGLKDLVYYQNGKPEGIHYDKMSVYLLEVLKTLKNDVEELKRRR